MAPRENENNALAKFGVTNKEHYGMFWYFLERSIYPLKPWLIEWNGCETRQTPLL